jgi:internalin A
MTHLTSLSLAHTKLTDVGLTSIARMPRLESLELAGTKIDGGSADISALARLEYLGLDETGIADEALSEVAALASLRSLSMCRTSIGDAGIALLVY